MYASQEEIIKLNKVQVEILKDVTRVCEALGIKYYMVHGSLLGTVRSGAFVPYDDDIDIAIKRNDYTRFLREAPALLSKEHFLQSCQSDHNYPLSFAKVRNNYTTYICDAVKYIDMNHGVYIDVFPIDCAEQNPMMDLISKILDVRISNCFYRVCETRKQKIRRIVAVCLCPSIRFAVLIRERINARKKKSTRLCVTGGKATEKYIPSEWFEETETAQFEGIKVYIPKGYKHYLSHIYGDYENRTLVEGKMVDGKVELNACVVDLDKSYQEYFVKR